MGRTRGRPPKRRSPDQDTIAIKTLDSWFARGTTVPKIDSGDGLPTAPSPPRKRRAFQDIRIDQAQNRSGSSTAWVQLPHYHPEFLSQFDDPLSNDKQTFEDEACLVNVPSEDELQVPISICPPGSRARSIKYTYVSDPGSSDDSMDEDPRPRIIAAKRKLGRARKTAASESDFLDDGSSAHETDISDNLDLTGSSSVEPSDVSDSDADLPPARKARATAVKTALSKLPTQSPWGKASSAKMKKLLNRGKGEARGLNMTLPPLFKIDEIFMDLVYRANNMGFRDAIDHLNSRKLRVATMCSGTESPLLALEMIQDSLKQLGAGKLEVDHLFSAEIVPYKQAYIERNFHPPIIFRDITELTDAVNDDIPMATTAYGGRVLIPTKVDICIAGTSCVDFSRLNSFKKGLDGGGESDKTWHAVLAYCRAFRPAIVLLENVRNAQWDLMLEHYEGIGYESAGVLVDTKDYYIPHTRQRGYMVCFDKEKLRTHGKSGRRWESLMEKFKRPASAPITSFLIPNHQIRSRLQINDDQPTREVDWVQCEITQMEYRQDRRLGNARPVTNWQESGSILPPDNAVARWFFDQVERVLDTIDGAALRKALPKNGMYDVRFKTRIWNLSQNIYRDEDNQPFGITGCITPSGIFFVSDAGRVLAPEETLKLQGLPIERISFTTETPAEMQDLAGNAMTTTVIGSAILSALIAGYEAINPPQTTELDSCAQTASPIHLPESLATSRVALHAGHVEVPELIEKAERSLRRCYCEGSTNTAEKAIQQCIDCGHTTCIVCGGNPLHNYRSNKALNDNRIPANAFEDYLKPRLPLVLRLSSDGHPLAKTIKEYREAAETAASETFTFRQIRRTHCWTAIYQAPQARMDLVIAEGRAEWRLYALPGKDLAGNSSLREMLQQPVAKANVSSSLLDVQWVWRIPSRMTARLDIKRSDAKIASWWCRNEMPDFRDHSVPEHLDIGVQLTTDTTLAYMVSGKYRYLPNCGKACDSLFQKAPLTDDEAPVFLFLDPSRTGPADDDCFIFSTVRDDLEYGEVRPILARIRAPWRPWPTDGKLSTPELIVDNTWAPSECRLHAVDMDMNIVQPEGIASLDYSSCSALQALVQTELPIVLEDNSANTRIVKSSDDNFFGKHAWAFEVIRRQLPESSDIWQSIRNIHSHCDTCAPRRPALRWKLGNNDNLIPYEDSETAAHYERAIKARPEAIVTEVTPLAGNLRLTLGLNVAGLAHRALARLSKGVTRSGAEIDCSWRFLTKSQGDKYIFKPFRLKPTRDIEPHHADVGMSVPLFHTQCLALAWMRKQELGTTFRLEETEEATIPSLGWRLEVRAQSDIQVRGGICADHPGFGKTLTSLALIHCDFGEHGEETGSILSKLTSRQAQHDDIRGLIPTAATLIICPGTLLQQWVDEIEDKLGSLKNVLAINKVTGLSKFTINDFEKARIILVNRSVLGSEAYTERLAAFAAIPPPATTSGRSFAQWLKFAAQQVPAHLKLLQGKGNGTETLKGHVKSKYKENLASDLFKAIIPSKRLRGAVYAAEASKKKGTQSKSKSGASGSVDTTSVGQPLFEMFYFNRLVVDEFHQYEQREYASITALNADSRWGLSATPALGDFYEISQIAGLLGIPLPIGSDQRGIMKIKNVRELRKDMTDFERFDTMRQLMSNNMHERIHEIDQRFLDTFVRQNIMDFDELTYQDHLVPVALDLAHRAVYTELSQHLNSSNMRIKKGNKSKATDRQELINIAVASSLTAEEALSKAAACSENAEIGPFVRRRQREMEQLASKDIPAAISVSQTKEPESFAKLKARYIADGFGDADTSREILALMKAGSGSAAQTKPKSKAKAVHGSDDDEDGGNENKAKGARATTAALNVKCQRLLVARRSLRYLENTLKLKEAVASDHTPISSICDHPCCDRDAINAETGAVSSFCGHIVCGKCHQDLKTKGIKHCPAEGCMSSLYDHHLLWSHKMGPSEATPYGAKIEAAVQILEKIKDQGEQAIIFVQFASQLDQMEAALERNHIAATVVKRSTDSGAQILDFRSSAHTSKHKTVIVLNASDETAAGSNLQNANHVIFLSPLLRDTQYGYESTMAQAIGRVRRHGQKKEIHVYRIVALDTIDVDILEHRERRTNALVEQGALAIEPPSKIRSVGEEVESERTQLVKDNGRFSLRPRSWLVGSGNEDDLEKVKGKSRVLGWEDYSSLVKFSRAFTEDD